MVPIFIRQSFNIYYASFDRNVLTSWLWNVWQVKLWHRDHKGYPCYDFVWKNNQWESCHRTLELRPTCIKYIKTRCGQTRAMHWCYKVVDSTLICHFSLAFRLGRSVNPPGPIFAIALLDSSFYAASVLCARLLHCVEVCSLMLAAIWLLKNLGFFPLAPLSTLSRRECIFWLDTVNASIVEGILFFC